MHRQSALIPVLLHVEFGDLSLACIVHQIAVLYRFTEKNKTTIYLDFETVTSPSLIKSVPRMAVGVRILNDAAVFWK